MEVIKEKINKFSKLNNESSLSFFSYLFISDISRTLEMKSIFKIIIGNDSNII
jgi:hypothetical protein